MALRRPQRRPLRRFFERGALPAEQLWARTSDGLKLSIKRVHDAPTLGPVMLLHGLAGTSATFHFPGRSLASYLAACGFDCYVVELRGCGDSDVPEGGFDTDDYLERDLPALIDTIQRTSGHERLLWVGHSLGGVLLYCYGVRHPDAPVLRAVTLGSAIDYTPGDSAFKKLLFLKPLLSRLRLTVPYGELSHALAPLLARVDTPFETFNVNPKNIEPFMTRKIYALAFSDIPLELLVNLSTAFEPTGLACRDRSFSYLQNASRYKIPTLMIGGTVDVQCPVEAVHETHRLLGDGACEPVILGKAFGHREDYGHWDLVLGKHARMEVWPRVESFLRG